MTKVIKVLSLAEKNQSKLCFSLVYSYLYDEVI